MVDENHLKYFHYNFEKDAFFVYAVGSFYVFTNIAILPVTIIVIRSNII